MTALSEIYLNSPLWLKAAIVLAPWLSLVVITILLVMVRLTREIGISKRTEHQIREIVEAQFCHIIARETQAMLTMDEENGNPDCAPFLLRNR